MRIAIVDGDLIERKKHRFPNLASMKISAWEKELGNDVKLITKWEYLMDAYDKIYVSKVFTDTVVPDWVLELPNILYGGTGFFFDKAPKLPDEIEHHMPDYSLYDDWVVQSMANGVSKRSLRYYIDYSIGFLTKGCFRHCKFCVNQNTDRAVIHSKLNEFLNPEKKKICLLDDNFLSHPKWKDMLLELQATGKKFQFNQGLDVRILTDEKAQILFQSKYDESYIFAFDDVDDYEIIEKKLKLIRKYNNSRCMFYVLVGFDKYGVYDETFWYKDILDAFKRIELLMKYGCVPYIMRFIKYSESPVLYRGMYVTLARWVNQKSVFTTKSFEEYTQIPTEKTSPRYLAEFREKTNIMKDAPYYLTMKFKDYEKENNV